MRVTPFIRQKDASRNDLTSRASVYFRVRDNGLDIKCASELHINPNHWSQERQGYKSRVALVDDDVRNLFDALVKELTGIIAREYHIGADSDWLRKVIFACHHPNAYHVGNGVTEGRTFAHWADRYLRSKRFDRHQECNTRGLMSKVALFERYKVENLGHSSFTMNIDSITADDLREFEAFLLTEQDLCGTDGTHSVNTVSTNMNPSANSLQLGTQAGRHNQGPFL